MLVPWHVNDYNQYHAQLGHTNAAQCSATNLPATPSTTSHVVCVRLGSRCTWMQQASHSVVARPHAIAQQSVCCPAKELGPESISRPSALTSSSSRGWVALQEAAASVAGPPAPEQQHVNGFTVQLLSLSLQQREQHGQPMQQQVQQRQQAAMQVDKQLKRQYSSKVSAYMEREHQKGIVRNLKGCSSIRQLAVIVGKYSTEMDAMSVTSCFTTAARLATELQQQQQQQRRQLAVEHRQQQRLDAGQAANQSTGFSGQTDLQLIVQQQLLPLLSNRLGQFDSTGLVLVTYSLAVLGHRNEAVLADLEQAVMPLAASLNPHLLSQLLWSFGTLRIKPQQLLLQRLLRQALRVMHEANEQDCAQLLHGLTKLGYMPPKQWMYSYLCQVSQLLETTMSPRALCTIVHSLGRLGVRAPLPLVDSILAASQPMLLYMPPAGLNMLCQGLRLLKCNPSLCWQHAYAKAVQGVMMDSEARNLPLLAAPLLRWRFMPPAGWCEQYLAASEGLLLEMQAQGLAVLGHTLAGLQVRPTEPWLVKFLTAAQHRQLASSPAGCSYLMHLLGTWQVLRERCSRGITPAMASAAAPTAATADTLRPNAMRAETRWHGAAPAAANSTTGPPAVHSVNRRQLEQQPCDVLTELVGILAVACMQCFLRRGEQFTAEQLGVFCKGLALSRYMLTSKLTSKLHQVAGALLQAHPMPSKRPTASTLANILLAVTISCRQPPNSRFMDAFWLAYSRLMPTVSAAQAAALAQAIYGLQVQPPAWFVQQMLERVAMVADTETDVQRLALLLSVAAERGWQVRADSVQVLVAQMLYMIQRPGSSSSHVSKQIGHTATVKEAVWPTSKVGSVCGISCLTASTSISSAILQWQQHAIAAGVQVLCAAATPRSSLGCSASNSGTTDGLRQQQQQQLQHTLVQQSHWRSSNGYASTGRALCSSSSNSGGAGSNTVNSSSSCSSSSSSSSQAPRLLGLANHRLKGLLATTVAAAAWAHALSPGIRQRVLHLCAAYTQTVDSRLLPALARHVGALVTGISSGSSSSSSVLASNNHATGVDQQQWVLLQHAFAAELQAAHDYAGR